jgi:hypothetical protein
LLPSNDPIYAGETSIVVKTSIGSCEEPIPEYFTITLERIELDETFTVVAEATYHVTPCEPYRSREGWCAPRPTPTGQD